MRKAVQKIRTLFAETFLLLGKSSAEMSNQAPVCAGIPDEDDTQEPSEIRYASETIDIQGVVVNHKGHVRGNNEDNFCFNGKYMKREEMNRGCLLEERCREAVWLYAVCDGMGGADCGEEASYLAVKQLAAWKQGIPAGADTGEMTSLLRLISERIYEEAQQRGQKSGTTIAMMLVNDSRVIFANVGDSRIYCFRDGNLSRVSMDHSKVQRMVSMGILTPEQARSDPDRHVITQYLGMPPEIKVSPYFVTGRELREADIYLLCSDGLTDMVEETRMEQILQESEELTNAVRKLLDEALKNGGRDNVTIMLVRVAQAFHPNV